jgi:hypothetical protein
MAMIREDGKVQFAGETYDSLSTAADRARRSVIGSSPGRPYPQTDGWTFWRYRDARGELLQMDELRRQDVAAKEVSGAGRTGTGGPRR